MKILGLCLLLVACGGEVASPPARVCKDPYDAEVDFTVALLKQGEHGALCSEAPQIETCLKPEDACIVCEALRCCPEVESCFLSTRAICPELDACLASKCSPICPPYATLPPSP